jgi:hypothetical protein
LTFLESGTILLAAGIGAIPGAFFWGGWPTGSGGARYSSHGAQFFARHRAHGGDAPRLTSLRVAMENFGSTMAGLRAQQLFRRLHDRRVALWTDHRADRAHGVPAETRIEFRVGINLGDIIIDGDDIFGDGVNVAVRLETLAGPGSICLSRVVRDQVRDNLAFAFEDMGEQQVKNIARPVHAHRIPIDAPVGGQLHGLGSLD